MYRSRNSRGIFAWLLLDVIWMLLTVAALVVSILLIESATGKCFTILYAITIGKSMQKLINNIQGVVIQTILISVLNIYFWVVVKSYYRTEVGPVQPRWTIRYDEDPWGKGARWTIQD